MIRIASLLLLICTAWGAESLNQKIAETDMSDPDSVYELAMWCDRNNKPSTSRRYLRKCTEIDPEYAPAWDALGYIYYKGEWQHAARVPADVRRAMEEEAKAKNDPRSGHTALEASGPGPNADQIEWSLTVPADPNPTNADWVNKQIDIMNRSGNYTRQMEVAYRTLLMDRYFDSAIHHLAKSLQDGSLRDLFGIAMMISEVVRQRDHEREMKLKRLLPFMVEASDKVSDPEDLSALCLVAAYTNEKRCIPRMIELLGSGNEEVVSSAKQAVSAITLMGEDKITVQSTQKWWDTYHNASDERIYGDMLNSNDLSTVVNAADKLTPYGWKLAIPALIRVLEKGDTREVFHADDLLNRLTGSKWLEGSRSQEEKEKKIELLKNWWADNQASFIPQTVREARNRAMAAGGGDTGKQTTALQLLDQLSSSDNSELQSARSGLRNLGDEAAGILIRNGIGHPDGIVRQNARDLLREITQQNFGLEPLTGSADEQAAARRKWEEWARGEGLLDSGEAPQQPSGDSPPARQPLP